MATPKRDIQSFLTQLGTDSRLRRLRPDQRWVYLAGILPIANRDGHLLITDGVAATAADVADQASVSRRLARESMGRFRSLGLIGPDGELGCERILAETTGGSRRRSDSPEERRRRKAASRKRGKQEAMLE